VLNKELGQIIEVSILFSPIIYVLLALVLQFVEADYTCV
jgi:hypothetical protein